MQTKIPEDVRISIWTPNQTSSNAQYLSAEHGHLQSICDFFSYLPSIPSHRKIAFDGWSSGQILASRKKLGSESSCDMSGHNTKTTTSNFRVDVQNKLATGLKGVTPYYSRLQTVTKPCFQMQSIAFAIIFLSKNCSHNKVWCYTEILLKGLLCTSLTTLRPRSAKVR